MHAVVGCIVINCPHNYIIHIHNTPQTKEKFKRCRCLSCTQKHCEKGGLDEKR